MRVFFTACIAALVIAVVGAVALELFQLPVNVAFSSASSVRI